MIKLSPRLKIVYDMLDKCGCIADVGCDHGYLSIAIAESRLADKVVAMDVNKGPLKSCQKNLKEAGLDSIIETRLSNGLAALHENEAEGICICGMGGLLISRILQADMDKAKSASYIILEPQSEYSQLRTLLDEEHFVIDDEDMICEENKFYPIIKAHFDNSHENLSDLEINFGPVLLKKRPDAFLKYLDKKTSEINTIIFNLQKTVTKESNTSTNNRIKELKEELGLIQRAKDFM